MVLGLTILVGALTITFNAVVDILYAVIDPGRSVTEPGVRPETRSRREAFAQKVEVVEGRSLWKGCPSPFPAQQGDDQPHHLDHHRSGGDGAPPVQYVR